ncbi:MAG: O-antigen ligase family protein [Chloroflexia bacterium]
MSSTETVGSRLPAAGSSDGQILPTADRLLPAASALSTLTDRLLFGALLLVLAMSPFEAGYRPLSRFFAARLTNLELTLLVLTAAWLLRLVMDSGARSRLIRMPLLAPIVALVGATLFSWAFGEYRALGGNYLYRLLMGTVVCLSAWEALKGTRRALAAVCTLVAVGTVSAALGLLEFAPWVNVEPWLAAFKPMPTTVGGVLRLSGTFEYANGAGMYFEMLLPLALGLAVYFGGRKRGAQFAAFVACAVIMAALLLTFSRAALLGALVALVLFGVTGVLGSRKSAASNAEEILTPGSRFARGRSAPALRSYPSTSTPVLSSLVIALVFMALGAVLIVATQPVFRLRLTSENDSTWYNVTYRPGPVPALAAGEWVTMPVTVRNDGPMIWRADGSVSMHLSYHWLSEDKKQIVYFDGARTRLPRDVGPGETVDLQAALVAPPEAGTYYLQWDMVQENVIWFSAKSSADNEPTRQMVGPPLTGAAEQAAQGGKPFDMPSPVDPGALNNFDAVDRTKLWKVAFAMFRAHPLTGVGPDGFRNLYGPYAGVTDWNKNIYTNNTYVEMFANLGLPGGLAFLALAAVSMWLALRGVLRGPVDGRWALCLGATAGLAAFFFHGFFDYFLFSTPMYAVFWFLLGLAVSSRRQTLTPDPRPPS